MKRVLGSLAGLLISFMLSNALAQVTSAEVLGLADTRPKSPGLTALLMDGSVGEVMIKIHATDANGNPAADAPVIWLLTNSTDTPSYVVGSSAATNPYLERAFKGNDLNIDGGVTDANGNAYLIVDSSAVGDTTIKVTVGGVEAKGYDGNDMRVVWF